jgi:O-antigen/teichoic acid export membrane protein
MAEHLSKLLRSTLLYLPAQITSPLVQFATTVAWTHLLDPATFGFVTFIIAVQEVSACLTLTGWTFFILRFRERFRGPEEPRFLAMDRRLALLASVAQLLLTPPLLYALALPCDIATIAATAAYLITRMLLTHYADWARAQHAIAAYTSGQLVASIVGSGLSVVAIMLLGPSCAVVLGAVALGQALALLALMAQANIRLGIGTFDKALFHDAKRYARLAIVGGVLGWGAGNAIRILVQHFEGPVALGLISVGWSLGQRIAGVLAMLLTAAAYPLAVKHLESGDREGALAQVSLNGLLLFGILLPSTVGVLMLSRPIVTLLIAEQFRETTITIFPIAMCAASFRFLRIHVCEQVMLMFERTKSSMYVLFYEAALNVTLCALGLHFGGFLGAASGMLIGAAISCIGSFIYCFRSLGLLAPPFSVVLRIALACVAMGLGLHVLPLSGTAASLIGAIFVGATIYAVAITVLFPGVQALWLNQARRVSAALTP